MSYDREHEAELWSRFCDGDDSALGPLMKAWGAPVRSYVAKSWPVLLPQCEEILAHLFWRLGLKRGKLDPGEPVQYRGYLKFICHEFYNRHRQEVSATPPGKSTLSTEPPAPPGKTTLPSHELVSRELVAKIDQAVATSLRSCNQKVRVRLQRWHDETYQRCCGRSLHEQAASKADAIELLHRVDPYAYEKLQTLLDEWLHATTSFRTFREFRDRLNAS